MNARSRYSITSDEQKVSYYKLGSGPPLLFLHGGRVEAYTFIKVLEALSLSYTVFAPDIPGYGQSPTPKDTWSFVDYAYCFDNFLAELNLTNVCIVGYSMGGGIALNLTAISKRVSKLILVDSSGLPIQMHSHHDFRRIVFYMIHPSYIATFYRLLRDYIKFLWRPLDDYKKLNKIRERCQIESYDEAFSKITVPTLILWGQDDWIYPLEFANQFKRRIAHAKLKTVPGTHDWLLYNYLHLLENML